MAEPTRIIPAFEPGAAQVAAPPRTKVIGRRVGATIIDTLLLFAVSATVFFSMASTDQELLAQIQGGEATLNTTVYGNFTINDTTYSIVGGDFLIYVLITSAIGILYAVVLPGLTGWTFGKLATGVRVVREGTTRPAGVGRNLVRYLLYIVDGFPYVIPWLTGFIVALNKQRNQRVGDIVAGTLVVHADDTRQPVAGSVGGAASPATF